MRHNDETYKSAVNAIYAEAFDWARTRGQPFTIKRSHVEIPISCPITGKTFNLGFNHGKQADMPKIVLVDQSRGYVPGNIRAVSREGAARLDVRC